MNRRRTYAGSNGLFSKYKFIAGSESTLISSDDGINFSTLDIDMSEFPSDGEIYRIINANGHVLLGVYKKNTSAIGSLAYKREELGIIRDNKYVRLKDNCLILGYYKGYMFCTEWIKAFLTYSVQSLYGYDLNKFDGTLPNPVTIASESEDSFDDNEYVRRIGSISILPTYDCIMWCHYPECYSALFDLNVKHYVSYYPFISSTEVAIQSRDENPFPRSGHGMSSFDLLNTAIDCRYHGITPKVFSPPSTGSHIAIPTFELGGSDDDVNYMSSYGWYDLDTNSFYDGSCVLNGIPFNGSLGNFAGNLKKFEVDLKFGYNSFQSVDLGITNDDIYSKTTDYYCYNSNGYIDILDDMAYIHSSCSNYKSGSFANFVIHDKFSVNSNDYTRLTCDGSDRFVMNCITKLGIS